MKRLCAIVLGFLLAASAYASPDPQATVRVKDLGRFLGWRENALVGYGIVTGLSGSGDSPRSKATRQAISNVLSRLGANIPADEFQSRNVAAVMVTAKLPPTAKPGDLLDLTVTSIGDARSLVGGTLLMAPLLGPDRRVYALAQGNLVVGGYDFQDNGNIRRKNYPTTGVVTGGATVETDVDAKLLTSDGRLTFVLRNADFTTAQRVADGLNGSLGAGVATVGGADSVVIQPQGDLYRFIAQVENIEVAPDLLARVVVNERAGTVIAGGNVRISSVVIAQGDIKISVDAEHDIATPYFFGGSGDDGRPFVYTNSKLNVSDAGRDVVVKAPNGTVADLVRALVKAKVGMRSVIAILQAMKAAGALHAEIVVQ